MERTPGTVLVTGACGNLGRAVAAAFAAQGRKLALLDRDAAQLADAFGADTGRQLSLACNLLDAASVAAAVGKAASALGPVTVLCNVAGGFRMGEAVHETSDATWNFLLDLNVRSVLHTARAVVPGLRSKRRRRSSATSARTWFAGSAASPGRARARSPRSTAKNGGRSSAATATPSSRSASAHKPSRNCRCNGSSRNKEPPRAACGTRSRSKAANSTGSRVVVTARTPKSR